MKDKTHSMNMDTGGAGAVSGFERLPDSEIATTRDRKERQMKWANLEDNKALAQFENCEYSDEDFDGGFIPRNNYEDRY